MYTFQNLRIERELPGVMTVLFDEPGRPVNVLDEGLLRELSELVQKLEADDALSLVVFRSGKDSGFLAGADVKRMQQIKTADELDLILRDGQELFTRIAALPMPTLAVIHGPCLGGGLEFALACTWRVARNDSATRMGLPETQLGVIPGWGGTQRLPRLIGLVPALRMILEAQRLPAEKARKLGLVDMTAPADHFDDAVNTFITDRLAGKSVRRPPRKFPGRLLDSTRVGRWVTFHTARKRLGLNVHHYPALTAALRAIRRGLRDGMPSGMAAEREEFGKLLFAPACRNLLDLFFLRENARKPSTWSATSAGSTHPILRVGVMGAGTMGAGIAQLAASQGYDVVLKDIRQDLVDAGMSRIKSLMEDAVRKGAFSSAEAEHHLRAIHPTTDEEAVAGLDLAIEAIIERQDVKRDLFRALDRRMPAESLIVSNTSSLSIRELARGTERPSQVAGLHFFNPVHRMALVEVVRADGTSDQAIATLVEFVRNLGKTPIVVRDAPGFLVNRILFPYLDEAVRLVCEGASVRSVDRAAEEFGMPMGPLELLDQVGIDIAADVSRTLQSLSVEPSPSAEYFTRMVADGRLGKKSGRGFYAYSGKHGKRSVAESTPAAPVRMPKPIWFADGEVHTGITQRLVLALVNEAALCLEEKIVTEPWMVDLAMVLGTGFAPFRGGPLKLADAWGTVHVVELLDRLTDLCGPRFKPCLLLREMGRQARDFYEHEPAAAQSGASPPVASTTV